MLEHLGLQVNRLIRVSFGPFQLGDLPDGAVEEVHARVLREQLGERIAQAAGADFSAPMTERERAACRAARTSLPPRGDAKRQRAAEAAATAQAPRRRRRDGTRQEPAAARHRSAARLAAEGAAPAAARASRDKRRTGAGRVARPLPPHAGEAISRKALMRIVGGRLRGRALAGAEVAGDPADLGPPARVAVQHPGARLRRSGQRRARARPVRRHRRARARGDLARRGLRAVRRRRRRGARADARQCRGARPRRRHPHLPPRRDEARRRRIRSSRSRWCSPIRPMARASPSRRSPSAPRAMAHRDALVVVEEGRRMQRAGFTELGGVRYDGSETAHLRRQRH